MGVARPEGLEPPTYRFEVAFAAQLQGLTEKSRSVLQIIESPKSLSIPALPYHYGNDLETNVSAGDKYNLQIPYLSTKKKCSCSMHLSGPVSMMFPPDYRVKSRTEGHHHGLDAV